jgi:hypothetical protein
VEITQLPFILYNTNMQFKISHELLTKIVNYLASKPWNEVNNLLIQIQSLVPEETTEHVEE